jgi:hypothetical protein
MLKSLSLLLLALASLAGPALAVRYPAVVSLKEDRANPVDFTGQLLFNSGPDEYVGSGTVVRASSILTAGHNVFDPETGFSTDLEFRRGNYGASALSDEYATRMFVLAGYQSSADRFGGDDVRAFAYDTAGLLFGAQLAAGKHAMIFASPFCLTNYYYRICIGYGAEGVHDGDYPLSVAPFTSFYPTYLSFYENTSVYFEGGMSGGPVFTYAPPYWLETGIIVSSATNPVAGGIRIIDAATVSFANKYLR